MTRRAVVVGAGFAGLSSAIRLAAAGVAVTLVERGERPGGRAGRLVRAGFAFDTGPSVLTMPALLDDLYSLAGERLADHLALRRLDPAYRGVFHDGSTLRIRGDEEAMREEVRAVCGAPEADRFIRFAERLRQLYEAEYATFIDANFDSAWDLARPAALARLLRLGGFRRVEPLVAGFLTDWRLVRMFTFQSMYAGMSPYDALGIYAVIAYMDAIAGVFFPMGGVHRVAEELAALAGRLGVDVRLGTPVDHVELRDRRAVAVRTTAGERFAADAVVLTPDLPVAYSELLPADATPRRLRRLRYSPSCVVVHLGVDQPLVGAAHHNIHFAEDYEASFDDVLGGRMQRDPSWFLTVPTVTDPALAPRGGAVGFYLLPAPNLAGDRLAWDAQGPREVRLAQRRLETAGYGAVSDHTVAHEVVTPADWAARGMAAGTPFAASHHFGQTGPFRPRNVAPGLGGVFFAGSSTTPGVGVPMVLISGKLAAERVLAYLGATVRGGVLWPRPPVAGAQDRAQPSVGGAKPVEGGRAQPWAGGAEAGAGGYRHPDPSTTIVARGLATLSPGAEGPVDLATSYELCRRLHRAHGRTYYFATRFLLPDRRPHVYALYGFARYADDLVDHMDLAWPPERRRSALESWSDRFLASLDAGHSDDPVLKAVVHTVGEFGISREDLEAFLRSMAMDLTVTRYATWQDLSAYMHGSAAVIGSMMLPLLGTTDPRAREPAMALGRAFQMTNFLRDVAEDYDRGRIYLPQEDLERFGVTERQFQTRHVDTGMRRLLAFEAERTRALYRQAEAGWALLPPAAGVCIRIAHRLYAEIIDRLEDHDWQVFHHRAAVPGRRKLAVAAREIVRPTRPRA